MVALLRLERGIGDLSTPYFKAAVALESAAIDDGIQDNVHLKIAMIDTAELREAESTNRVAI